MHKMLYHLKSVWIVISNLFRKTYTANACGHRTKKTGRVTFHGESHMMSMPLSENGNPDYCLACIGKMSIRCAWCESSIHIGDPLTLYIADASAKVLKHAVRYDQDPDCVVGCLRWDCASSGADRQGFWMPPGKVERVPSPIEMLMESMANGGGEKMVIVSDLGGPNKLGKVV